MGYIGTVKFFNKEKKMGFVSVENEEYFFHWDSRKGIEVYKNGDITLAGWIESEEYEKQMSFPQAGEQMYIYSLKKNKKRNELQVEFWSDMNAYNACIQKQEENAEKYPVGIYFLDNSGGNGIVRWAVVQKPGGFPCDYQSFPPEPEEMEQWNIVEKGSFEQYLKWYIAEETRKIEDLQDCLDMMPQIFEGSLFYQDIESVMVDGHLIIEDETHTDLHIMGAVDVWGTSVGGVEINKFFSYYSMEILANEWLQYKQPITEKYLSGDFRGEVKEELKRMKKFREKNLRRLEILNSK